MSGKLDKPLDEIVSAQRRSAGRRRSQRGAAGRAAAPAPVGGIKKNSKPPRGPASKVTPARAAAPQGESKVIVSNLVCLLQLYFDFSLHVHLSNKLI